MPSIEILLIFTASALLMNISPGPSNLYVMARSLSQGVMGGVMAALGLAIGSLVFVAATAIGLSQLFTSYPMVYMVMKYTGAAYLLYLGWSYVRPHGEEDLTFSSSAPKPYQKILKESILVEVTNPKSALFFITFLPQFVSPDAGPVWSQLLLLGIIVTLSAVPCDLFVAFFSAKAAQWIVKNRNAQRIQEYLSGGILITLGFYVIIFS